MYFDSHCHLTDPAFEADLPAVLKRAREAGVSGLVTVGETVASSRRAVELAAAEPDIWAAVGIHPHEARTADEATLDEIADLARHPKVVAIGETGLDFHYLYSPAEAQRDAFARQIRLARGLNLPVVVHSRKAYPETLELLHREGRVEVRAVLHCFSGDEAVLAQALALGLSISLAGMVTFRNYAHGTLLRTIPLERLMVETDAPALAPHPYRGKRNEPALLPLVVAGLARALGLPPEEVARLTAENARRFYGLSLSDPKVDPEDQGH